MTDKGIALLIIAIFVLVIPLSLGLALWLVSRLRRKSDQPLSQDGAGGILVPVRQLTRHFRFFGYSKNGISPRLEIVQDGLLFKVFKPDRWLFTDIVAVDMPWSPFATRLIFRHRTEGQLYIDVADKARAGDLLRALPRTIALTDRATATRDMAG